MSPSAARTFSPVQLRAAAELARRRLLPYTSLSFPQYNPNWHHQVVASVLEDIERGKRDRVMIFQPPRHGKSELSSVRFPAYYLGRKKSRHVIQTSYGADLAVEFGRKVRDQAADPLYPLVFGKTVHPSSSAVDRWATTDGGQYIASGVDGAIVGRGADLLIIDDPIKNYQEAYSTTYREKLWNWYLTVAKTRLQKNAAVLVNMTRWHMDDLAGRLLDEDRGKHRWHVITLPAIAEEDEKYRKKGEALWPAFFPMKYLEEVRDTSPLFIWESLYQQKPPKDIGSVFNRETFKYYNGDALPKIRRKIHSWDTAFKKGQEADFSVNTVWAECENGYYLLNVWRARAEFPELKRQAIAMYEAERPHAVLVEDKASGQSLVQELKRETRIPVMPIKVDTDKLARAHAVTPLFASGRVFFPEKSPWLASLMEEMIAFPAAAHDDQVDSVTQALNYLRAPRLPGFFVVGAPK